MFERHANGDIARGGRGVELLELQGDPDLTYRMSFSAFRETVRLTAPKDPTPASMVTPNNSAT